MSRDPAVDSNECRETGDSEMWQKDDEIRYQRLRMLEKLRQENGGMGFD